MMKRFKLSFRVEVQEFAGDLSSPERGPEEPQGSSGFFPPPGFVTQS
jgi:hypothetical protein